MTDQPQAPVAPPGGAPPRLPSEFYPGPGAVNPLPRREPRRPAADESESDSDSDADSSDSGDEGGPRRGARRLLTAIALAVAVVLIIVILYYMFAPRTLSQGLMRRGWTIYLMKGCHFCHKQMNLLPGYDRYILCDNGAQTAGYTRTPAKSCAEIKSFPYWFNPRTGEDRVGFQDTAALQRMAQW